MLKLLNRKSVPILFIIFVPVKAKIDDIKVIAFDADDTLWDCQSHFETVENQLYEMIGPWTDNPAHELLEVETGNMQDLGYGSKAFTLSVLQTAITVSRGRITATQLGTLLDAGKGLLHLPATPLPEVKETLQRLHDEGKYRLVVFTKGELQDQENKLHRSGLAPYFEHVEITSNKTSKEFLALCRHLDVRPEHLLMVGNSFRSDIAPAITIGAYAVHIPFHVTWQLEHSEEFEHERVFKIKHLSELFNCIA